MYKHWIGADPGVSGGIALISDLWHSVEVWPMPDTERDLWELIERYIPNENCIAMIEDVHAFPGDKQRVKQLATFMRNYGGLRMALIGNGVAMEKVSPQKWQKYLGCLTKGDKKISKGRAQELFPGVKGITLKTADALLIAEYGKRIHAQKTA